MAPVAVAVAAAPAPATGAAAPPPGTAPVDEAPATFGELREVAGVKVGGTAVEAQLAHLAAPDPAGPTAGQRYRTALELLANREYEKATSELTQAIVLDPRLAVAYAARGSARFGLGRYREAADDYRTSLSIDDNLATPLYGLAECYRVLGDGRKAAEMYQRYADSRAPDVREDLRTIAAKRAQELTR
jgi:tetratricopeptide (TPR) repeat protein